MRYGPSRIMSCVVCLLTVPISVQMHILDTVLDEEKNGYVEKDQLLYAL